LQELYSEFFNSKQTVIISRLLANSNRVLPEKLTVLQLVKIFSPPVLWNPKIHFVFKRTCHWTRTWTKWIQSIAPQCVSC